MRTPHWQVGFLTTLLFTGIAVAPASAQLPTNDPPWLGYFAVSSNRHYEFSLTTHGKIMLTPVRENQKPVWDTLAIPIAIVVEESRPDGKTSTKLIQPTTLKSSDHATTALEKTTIHGQVTGGAVFEVSLEQNRGVISIGGRLIDPGTLKQNPLKFSIRVKFPPFYSSTKKTNKDRAKIFEKKISDDRIDVTWIDGKGKRQKFGQAIDAASKDLNGPGIAAVQIESSAYPGRKFQFTASPHSSMTLSNEKNTPLHKGFSILWTSSPAKNPEGKARLSFEVK